jgi:hypothetical protein
MVQRTFFDTGPSNRLAAGMLVLIRLVSIGIALLTLSCAHRVDTFEIVPVPPDGGASPSARTSTYEAARTLVVEALERELSLPRVDASLVLFPNRRAFELGLLQVGYPEALARSASSFSAIGGARAVLMNAGVTDRLTRTERIRLIAHELVHTLQYQLIGGRRGGSEQWLREGFAGGVACRVTARLGLGSFDTLRDDVIRQLAGVRLGTPPAPFDQLATFPQWVEAQQRYDVPVYAQAFVAAELLVETRGVAAIVGYFKAFKDSEDRAAAFGDAFGLDRVAFEGEFVPRWHATVARANTQR